MNAPRAYVTFEFRLPMVLMLCAQPGPWSRAPRGTALDVARDGRVVVTSFDRHETYARKQVLRLAAAFLRSVDDKTATMELLATLYPANGDRAIRHSIVLGASVAITPTFTQAELIEPAEADLNYVAG
jgi:hypothetical protein